MLLAAFPGRFGHFNSHARVGRDVWSWDKFRVGMNFNSHARVGRD